MADHDITCRDLSLDTTAYLDGAMSPRVRTTFEQHLVFCPMCVVHLAQVRTTREVLASLADAPVPQAVLDALGAGRG